MVCPRIDLCSVTATAVNPGPIRVNTSPVAVVASAKNAGAAGDCSRSGKVDFYWQPIATGSSQVALNQGQDPKLVPKFATIFDNKNNPAPNTALAPGDAGTARYQWTPTTDVVGNTTFPVIGSVVGAVICDESHDGGNCNCAAVGEDPGSDYTRASDQLSVLGPRNMMDELRETFLPEAGSIRIGFGIHDGAGASRLFARALGEGPFHDLVVPALRLWLARPVGLPAGVHHHSGPVRMDHHVRDARPADEVELDIEKGSQGVLQVDWPPQSHGKSALFAVWQEVERRRIGGFLLGLRHLPIDDPRFLWR